jgi:serine/threonine-protein kinase
MQPEQLGPYRIDRQIGRGGMGTVYAAVDANTGEAAAVKVLTAALATDEDFRARFDIEIETLRKLRHENIVRLLGWGEQDGVVFYAMELVDGTSLEDELRAGRRFEWAEVKEIAVQICAALKHAHDRGVVHRDIKPANLLLARDRKLKLSDFGIAKLFGSAGATTAGGVLGTAEYMAPEQADGRPVGHRGDLYSLGAVLFTLLAGRPPFVAKSVPQLLQMQRFAQPEPLRRYNKSVPIEVEAIVMQLLEKDPERRIPNATVLARRLEATFRGLATLAIREQQGGEDASFDLTASPSAADANPSPADMGPANIGPADMVLTRVATRPADADAVSASEATRGAAATPHRSSGSGKQSDSKVRSAQRRFTTVDEEPVGLDTDQAEPTRWLSPQTILFLIALMAVGLAVAYFLQPPSADALYDRVKSRLAAGDPADLLACEDDVNLFLTYYRADSRSREMEKLSDDIELTTLENRLENKAKMSGTTAKLSLVERMFLEAIRLESSDPPTCVEKLEAIAQLYEGGRGISSINGQRCVLLATRRAARLKTAAQKYVEEHVTAQTERLDHADALQATEPDTARQIRQAVIQLYREKPWAAEFVERAKKALDAAGTEEQKPAAVHDPS